MVRVCGDTNHHMAANRQTVLLLDSLFARCEEVEVHCSRVHTWLTVDVILPQVAYRVVDKRLERALDRMGVHYVPPECSDVDASKGLPGV